MVTISPPPDAFHIEETFLLHHSIISLNLPLYLEKIVERYIDWCQPVVVKVVVKVKALRSPSLSSVSFLFLLTSHHTTPTTSPSLTNPRNPPQRNKKKKKAPHSVQTIRR